MNNTLTDLATLTNIPEKILEKLFQSIAYIICQAVLEDTLDESDITSIDLNFGILYIKHENSELKFKFVPSKDLEDNLKETITQKLNLMENTLTDKISVKLLEIYKELC